MFQPKREGNYNELYIFVQVVAGGTFTAAAQRLEFSVRSQLNYDFASLKKTGCPALGAHA